MEFMKNLDIEGIHKKLIGMAKRLNLLSQYKNMTLDEYRQNEERQAVVERCLEIITQAAIDGCVWLSKEKNQIALLR